MKNLINSSYLLKEIYNSTLDYGIFTTDLQGAITTWNQGAERIIGFAPHEIIGKKSALLFTPEDVAQNEHALEMNLAKNTGRAEDYRWHMRKDGSRFWADGVLTSLHDDNGNHVGYLKMLRDITDRKYAEEELHRAANCDMLTGVANRYAFDTRGTDLVATAVRSKEAIALHLIDLDGFKHVNDTLGHQIGDVLLQQVARRMRNLLRESDFIARLGGDEFTILQTELPSVQSCADLATRIIRKLGEPFSISGHNISIGASIGIAICPHDASDLSELLKKSDLAMYRAKQDGKARYHYFTQTLDAMAHARSRDLAELRHAIENRDFRIVYQPQVRLTDRRIIGVEALLRCTSPAFAGRSIEELITLAVEGGLMKDLSYWVIEQACRQLRYWKDQGISNVRMCINICSQDLVDPMTPSYIEGLLIEMDLQPDELEVELTERQALDVEHQGLPVMKALRDHGIRIALDDFGTGYSALSYLRKLPVTSVKLDKSFLFGIPEDAEGCAVVKAVIDIAHALKLETVAEGVETDPQADFLKMYECTALQGYLVSKPVPAEEMTSMLLVEA